MWCMLSSVLIEVNRVLKLPEGGKKKLLAFFLVIQIPLVLGFQVVGICVFSFGKAACNSAMK